MCRYDTKGFLIKLTTEHPIRVKIVQWVRVSREIVSAKLLHYYIDLVKSRN